MDKKSGVDHKNDIPHVNKILCPNCHHLNRENAKFCASCGTLLPKREKRNDNIYPYTPDVSAKKEEAHGMPRKLKTFIVILGVMIFLTIISIVVIGGLYLKDLKTNSNEDKGRSFYSADRSEEDGLGGKTDRNEEKLPIKETPEETQKMMTDGEDDKLKEDVNENKETPLAEETPEEEPKTTPAGENDGLKENADVNKEIPPAEETVEEQPKATVTEEAVEEPKVSFAKENVEDEILRIREKYNEIVGKIAQGSYESVSLQDGVIAYYEASELRSIEVSQNVNQNPYRRFYYYNEGKLFFAYYEYADAHRLYFYDEQLIRWRYSKNAVNAQDAVNYDLEQSQEYLEWESSVLNESNQFKNQFLSVL